MNQRKIDPWLGLRPPERLGELYDQLGDLLDQFDLLARDTDYHDQRRHCGFDVLPRVAFPMRWHEVPADKINRCESMLSGPLFTSNDFPWPITGQWQVPAEPLLQMRTTILEKIWPLGLDDGLVQVWMDDWGTSIVRFVPITNVSPRDLTAPPQLTGEALSKEAYENPNVYREWPDGLSSPPWFLTAFSFVGLDRPLHEFPTVIEYALEDLDYYEAETTGAPIEKLQELSRKISAQPYSGDIFSLTSHPKKRLDHNDLVYGSLFGTFRSVQNSPYEIFESLALPLIDLSDYDKIFDFGYGDAQLLTPLDDPGSVFVFDWSTS
ncbi:hypothetical protein [Qipengyuania sp. JC766]|uniref:hypothetical protein n=1 Tax=Qipengyuania sp. JC766 TaxID=3232139 RepID=UPI003457A16E